MTWLKRIWHRVRWAIGPLLPAHLRLVRGKYTEGPMKIKLGCVFLWIHFQWRAFYIGVRISRPVVACGNWPYPCDARCGDVESQIGHGVVLAIIPMLPISFAWKTKRLAVARKVEAPLRERREDLHSRRNSGKIAKPHRRQTAGLSG